MPRVVTCCVITAWCLILALMSAHGQADPRCPTQDSENATLLPNPLNCTTYFMCDHGVAIEKVCPPGLYFNPVQCVCDFPNNVECQQPQVHLPIMFICPHSENNQASYFSDPYDCGWFMVCDPGTQQGIPMQCPPGLQFNPSVSVCDYPEVVNCDIAK